MEFYFYPADESMFKERAVNNCVRTLVFDVEKSQVIKLFPRKVGKLWEQTFKNNIETDHRIKELPGNNYQIFSWVVKTEKELGHPGFLSVYE